MEVITISDYTVDIQAELHGFEQIEAKIKALESNPIDLKINLSGTNGDFTKEIQTQMQGLAKQFHSAGTNIGNEFMTGLNSSVSNSSAFAKQQAKIQKTISQTATKMKPDISSALPNVSDKEIERYSKSFANKYVNSNLKATRDAEKTISKYRKQAANADMVYNTKSIGQKTPEMNAMAKYYTEQEKLFTKAQKIKDSFASSSEKLSLSKLTADLGKLDSGLTGFDNVSKEVDKATASYKKLDDAVSSFQSNNSVANAEKMVDAYEDLTKTMSKAGNEVKSLSIENSGFADPKQIANFQASWKKFYDSNTKMHKKYGQEWQQIMNASMSPTLTTAENKRLQTQAANLKKNVTMEGLTGISIFDEAKRGIKQIGQFVGTYGMWMQAVNIGKKMISEVVNVDSAMTELKKVSNASNSEITNYFSTAADDAKELGAAISDVIRSTADWSRLGYGLKDSQELSRLTTLYQNVGDNMTQEKASESLVSTLQGFKKAPSEAEHIIDAFNEVGNKFAIGSDGIGEALQRSASSMDAAGNTMEETIGLVTAANEVVNLCHAA